MISLLDQSMTLVIHVSKSSLDYQSETLSMKITQTEQQVGEGFSFTLRCLDHASMIMFVNVYQTAKKFKFYYEE